jgi:hypothetical protein
MVREDLLPPRPREGWPMSDQPRPLADGAIYVLRLAMMGEVFRVP